MKKVLSILLVALLLVGMLPMHALHTHAAEVTTTLTFDASKTNRTSYSTSKQVWAVDGLTFTNEKASSSSNVADYSNPVRLYQGSTVTIEHTGMTKVVITSDTTAKYKTALANSLTNAGYTYTASSNVYTITLSPAVDSITFSLTAQARFMSIAVTATTSDSVCAHSNTTTTTVDATCTEDGSVTEVCDDCGETVSVSTTEALGHSYNEVVTPPTATEDGYTTYTCSVCGDTYTGNTVPALGETYTVSFVVPDGVTAIADMECNSSGITLPTAGVPSGDVAYTFAGWATSEIDNSTEVPTVYTGNYTATANTTLYAVYTYSVTGEGGSTGAATDYALYSGELTEGDYVIVYDNVAMNTTVSSSRLMYNDVTISNDVISNPEAEIIWHIAPVEDYWTIYNNADNVYAASTGAKNKAGTTTSVTEYAKWIASGTTTYEFVNVVNTDNDVNANLRRNTTYGFACYSTSTGGALSLYKAVTSSGTTYYTTVIGSTSTECEHTDTTTTTVDATCTTVGSVTVTCDDCGATISTTEIPQLDHSYGTGVVTAPTCTEDGYTTYTCSVCGDSYTDSVTEASGHSYESVTSGLTTTYTCTTCGHSYTETENLEVKYELVTPDTAEAGNYVIGAVRSGAYPAVYLATNKISSGDWVVSDTSVTAESDVISGELPSDAQVFVLEGDNDDGFTIGYHNGTEMVYLGYTSYASRKLAFSAGYSNFLWKIAEKDGKIYLQYANGSNYYISQNSTGTSAIRGYANATVYTGIYLFAEAEPDCVHIYGEGVVTAPTCTTDGYTTHTCTVCGYSYTDSVVDALDHIWSEGVQTTDPGCTTTGVMTYTCTRDSSHTKTENIPATGHTMGEGVVVKATCETDGSKTYTCTVCGTQTVETVSATGHSWNSGEITTAATCETVGVRTYTCANAGCTKTEEIPATGHSWNEGETITAATCDAPGSILYTCQNDSTHTKTETISALGHTYVDGACTVCGSEVSHFKLVTDYKDILEGGQFVLAIRSGDTYYALGTADNTFGSDMPGCVVTVQGSGADSWVEWTDTVPVWNVGYYSNGQNNSFTLSYGGTYLTHTGGTSFGSASDPFAWTLLNKDADGNNEYDNDYAVIAEDGVVSYYTASSKELNRSINLYKTSPDVYFRTYSNNNNFDTVCFFKVVKTAGESCTVTFMENGSNTMSQTVANGEYIALPEPTLDTYPSGYTHFVGWVTLPCLETLTAPDEIYYVSENAGDQDSLLQVTEDMTLYALYSRTDPDAEGQSMSYYQVTDESQLVVGQYYIIVGYDAANDKWFAMSLDQYADARGGSWITPDENGVITITPNDRVATFHLEQGYNTGSYGFFDVIGNRFLSASAATEDNNSLRSADTLGVNESFTIAINADGSYSIISMEKDSVTYLVLYNTNDNKNPLFSCYDDGTGIDTTKTYLYVGQTNTVPGTYYATGTCEHDYQQTAHVDASCTTAGYTQYTCSICGEVKFDDVYAHGHNLGEATVIEPTCTQAGSSTSVCQNEDCGEEWVEVIPALGHTEVTDAAVEATCTTTGLTEGSHCSVCNEVLVAQEEIPALGHDYVGTVEINEQNVPVLTHQCSRCDDNYSIELKFSSANPVLENTLIMNFKTLDNIVGEDGFTNVRATFLYGQRDLITVNFDEALSETGKYVFPCRYITPSQVGDTITATIYGTYNNVEYSYQMEYSVAQYCYNMLEKYPESTELRTLLVDLLYYCDYARAYTTYKDDESVTAALTEEQKAFASADRELSTVTNINYAPAENEKATWKAASLIMYHSTRMQLRFALAEGTDIANVTVKVLIGSTESVGFITESTNYPGQYLVTVDELAAHQLSTPVYVTLYEGETAISNTICYSAESYAYNKQNDPDVKLVNLVKAMMRYGNSAKEYMS